jgi:glutaredoxin
MSRLVYHIIPTPSNGVFTIYTKSDCVYCTKVKKLLENEKTVLVDCDFYLSENRDHFLATMDSFTKREHRTFPFVFKDETFLGGYDDTVVYMNSMISFNEDF